MSTPIGATGGVTAGSPDGATRRAAAQPVTGGGPSTQPNQALAALNGGTSTPGASSGTTAAGNGALSGTDTFLKLLVAQLRNQDPTSPMDDQAFVTELAQFNTVEQMLNLKQAMTSQLAAQQVTEGVAFLGRTVTYSTPGVGGAPSTVSQGQVSGVSMAAGQVQLQIGTSQIPLSEVTAVADTTAAQAAGQVPPAAGTGSAPGGQAPSAGGQAGTTPSASGGGVPVGQGGIGGVQPTTPAYTATQPWSYPYSAVAPGATAGAPGAAGTSQPVGGTPSMP